MTCPALISVFAGGPPHSAVYASRQDPFVHEQNNAFSSATIAALEIQYTLADHAYWEQTDSTNESLNFFNTSNLRALFRIIDPKFAKKVLDKAPDSSHVQHRVDKWIEDHGDVWSIVQNHLKYCDSLRQSGLLGTTLDAPLPDVRWELFIKYGPPTNWLVMPGECFNRPDTCAIWTYVWTDSASQQGQEFACCSRFGEKYPTEIINDKDGFRPAQEFWPITSYSKFPCANGTTDLAFSIWVPGNQFIRSTLENSRLLIDVELFDSTRTNLISKNSWPANLQVLRGLLQATNPQERQIYNAMAYTIFSGLPPNKYKAHISLYAGPFNNGDLWQEIDLSQQSKISDMLILAPNKISGALLPGIIRADRQDLYNNPQAIFHAGADLRIYLEALIPEAIAGPVKVWATLDPLHMKRQMKSTILIGKEIVVADSLNQPLLQGKWQSLPRAQLDSLMNASNSSQKRPMETLYEGDFDAQNSLIIDIPVHLGKKLPSGLYILSLQISDPKTREYFVSTRRIIEISNR